MKITPNCKILLEAAMSERHANCFDIRCVDDDNGEASIEVDLIDAANANRVIDVDGVKVSISIEDEQALSNVIFSEKDGGMYLAVEGDECGCGCGGHHHHEGECCGCGEEGCGCGEEGCSCGDESCGCGEGCRCQSEEA